MKDLLALVADKNSHYTLKGAFRRHRSLGIRPIEFSFLVHPGRDGGTRSTGPEILSLKRKQFSHALLLLDFEGSGTKCPDAASLEQELDCRLQNAWGDHAKAIVIDPEVDIWMWGSDARIAEAIDWSHECSIREWLERKDFELQENTKPVRPKEALEAILRCANVRRSSSLYETIASRVSIPRCTDPAARRLREQLQAWFPPAGT